MGVQDLTETGALNMLYAAEEEDDLAFLQALENLQADYSDHFRFYTLLNNPPMGWTEGIGYITEDHIKAYLPYPPSKDQLIIICGPPVFETIMCNFLAQLKYPRECYYAFSKDVS
mmetsp:Transcript_16115/g.18254  ORF Transcript_16115/g.18254 Transcript_16115/m.18254 type:complete len:115 (-) Transcript_16115:1371-1715(-)